MNSLKSQCVNSFVPNKNSHNIEAEKHSFKNPNQSAKCISGFAEEAVNDKKKKADFAYANVNSKIGSSCSPSSLLSHDIGISKKMNYPSGEQRKEAQILLENQQVVVNKIDMIIISLPVTNAITRGLWKQLKSYSSQVYVINDGTSVRKVGLYQNMSEKVPEKSYSN